MRFLTLPPAHGYLPLVPPSLHVCWSQLIIYSTHLMCTQTRYNSIIVVLVVLECFRFALLPLKTLPIVTIFQSVQHTLPPRPLSLSSSLPSFPSNPSVLYLRRRRRLPPREQFKQNVSTEKIQAAKRLLEELKGRGGGRSLQISSLRAEAGAMAGPGPVASAADIPSLVGALERLVEAYIKLAMVGILLQFLFFSFFWM